MWSAVTGRPRSKVAETRSLGKPERGRELHFWRETSSGTKQLPSEQVDCAAALYDFLDAVRHNLEPGIFGRSAFPRCRFCRACKMPGMPNMAACQFQAVDGMDEQSPQCVASIPGVAR